MAPFPDSSLSKVFLSLYLMNLSHPFSPCWSQGQMLLQHFIPPLSPASLILPAANLGSHSKSCPRRRRFPASGPHPSWLSFPFLFASVEKLPQEWECGAFLQFWSLYWWDNSTPKAEPCFQSKPTPWAGRTSPKWRRAFVPGLALSSAAQGMCFTSVSWEWDGAMGGM